MNTTFREYYIQIHQGVLMKKRIWIFFSRTSLKEERDHLEAPVSESKFLSAGKPPGITPWNFTTRFSSLSSIVI